MNLNMYFCFLAIMKKFLLLAKAKESLNLLVRIIIILCYKLYCYKLYGCIKNFQ